MDTEVYNDVAYKNQDTLYENKTEVKAIDEERQYETIKCGNIASDKSNRNDYRQPYSRIQQPYIDICDINVKERQIIVKPAATKTDLEDTKILKRRKWYRQKRVICWALSIAVCLAIIELLIIIYVLIKEDDNEFKKEIGKVCGNTTGNKWHLGMNLNPSDGHIMDFTIGWDDGNDIGNADTAFFKDYLSKDVWNMPVNYVGIVRHQNGLIEAVKVWEFKKKGQSMLTRFQAVFPGREIATIGGSKQVYIFQNVTNRSDDPIFSIPGDIAINWRYADNGCRIALTGGHLTSAGVNDDNTHGFGNHFYINATSAKEINPRFKHEISNIQYCPYPSCPNNLVKLQGSDHGNAFKNGPVYGNYAIYVSKDAQRFPICGQKLMLEMNES